MKTPHLLPRPKSARSPMALATAAVLATLLAACGGGHGDEPNTFTPEPTRPQDSRSFLADATSTTFAAMAAAPTDTVAMSSTSRYAGVLNGAAYRVEVPANWNGKLVMYAHGYAGTGANLGVSDPTIRRHLIQNGYAWAASSYLKNYYDVRAGVEDTNALALAFPAIAAANGRAVATPTRYFIIGHSMGGHIAGAAVEQEALDTAQSKVRYAAAMPMCGVMGDTDLANYFGGMQVAAHGIAGYASTPMSQWGTVGGAVTAALFTSFPSTPTATGNKFLSVLKNISGGTRPMFNQGVSFGGSLPAPWSFFGTDGTYTGILNQSVTDTTGWTYVIDGDTAGSATLNANAQRVAAVPDANRLRRDGLRWIPVINGEISVPVMSLHTLGDLFVPFSMQQIYQRRVAAKSNTGWLVQRAIRGASHCDFTVAEQATAFDDLMRWEQGGAKPAGDDVLTAATVANANYGCTFTRNTLGPDDSANTRALRGGIAATSAPCP